MNFNTYAKHRGSINGQNRIYIGKSRVGKYNSANSLLIIKVFITSLKASIHWYYIIYRMSILRASPLFPPS